MASLGRPRGTPRPKRGRKPPAEHIIFGRPDRQSKSEGRATAGWSARLVMNSPLAWEIDMKALTEWISVNLAAHYRRQLLAGQLADGSGAAPDVKPYTLERARLRGDGQRLRKTLMVRSGWGADRVWLGKIIGSTHSAKRTIKMYGGSDGPTPPGGGPGRDLMWNLMLQRGFDPLSVVGSAKRVIADTISDWLKTTVGIEPGVDIKTVGEALLKDVEDDG